MNKFFVLASWMLATTLGLTTTAGLRAPAVPLVVNDPYFSVWSPADQLAAAETTHWTGKPQPLHSLVRIDGQAFRLLGKEPVGIPALPQTGTEVLPTRTLCHFANAQIELTLRFMTAALPADLEALARPVTYLEWELRSTDGRPHTVQLYVDGGAELAVNTLDQAVVAEPAAIPELVALKAGNPAQPVLAKRGDDLRIDWGYAYLAAPAEAGPRAVCGAGPALREQFATRGVLETGPAALPPPPVATSRTALALAWDLGPVEKPTTRWAMLAYDDGVSIKYFNRNLQPYWRRQGATAETMLQQAAREHQALAAKCEQFDRELLADLRKAGGEEYAQLCALAYRQTFAGNKLAADANGLPLLFPKENFSNGCISTVDVLFPQAPFFLLLSPALTKAMLRPALDYAASPLWKYGYAPHDLGTYPHATGQVYGMGGGDGSRMPVEESGNMLILMAALAKSEGNASFAEGYWPMLRQWADYLVANGLDPENQLCSADMFGHLPHCANLALKATIGIASYGRLCEMAGRKDEAARYLGVARAYAIAWQEKSKDDGRTRLAYHLPGTWGMKHNLVWDQLLGLGLFPPELAHQEVAWYLKVQNPYGLPVDNRTKTCLIDWALWSIAPAPNQADFEALVKPLYKYANETPSRVPLSDWFDTTTGKQVGMQARPVVGGLYMRLLLDSQAWDKYARAATAVQGPWAPLPLPPIPTAVLPTAAKEKVLWKWTTTAPAAGWEQPGFDDHAWQEGPAGFGSAGTPGLTLGTPWTTSDLWIRRTVRLPANATGKLMFQVHHDEDTEIYVDGLLATKVAGYTTDYELLDIAPPALAKLKPGAEVILAAHCHQTV